VWVLSQSGSRDTQVQAMKALWQCTPWLVGEIAKVAQDEKAQGANKKEMLNKIIDNMQERMLDDEMRVKLAAFEMLKQIVLHPQVNPETRQKIISFFKDALEKLKDPHPIKIGILQTLEEINRKLKITVGSERPAASSNEVTVIPSLMT
jgi:hypothetical protein